MVDFSTTDRASINSTLAAFEVMSSFSSAVSATTSHPYGIMVSFNISKKEQTEGLLLDQTCVNNSGQLTCLSVPPV